MKPIVRYTRVENLALGQRALVWAIDHPSPLVSNDGPAETSPVMLVYAFGGRIRFETQNTLYVPRDDLIPLPQELLKPLLAEIAEKETT